MREHCDPLHPSVPLKFRVSHGEQFSCPVASVPTRASTKIRLSYQGRALLTRTFDSGCHFPSRDQKYELLRELQKTDPGYTLPKLVAWFSNRRKSFQQSRREHNEDVLKTLLDPTTALAREMWPSLSADTLRRLQSMLLEQPHLTVQHKEILASHFGVERKHMENFLNWRVACMHPEDSHLPRELVDDDLMDMDEPPEMRTHLPTPAGSTSPEPLHHKTPLFRSQMHSNPPSPLDTIPSASGERVSGWPTSPGSTPKSYLRSPPLHVSPNTAPYQANALAITHLASPPHDRLCHAEPIQRLPASSSALPNTPSGVADAGRTTSVIGQEHSTPALASAAAPGKPAAADASSGPRTLRELEEAYAPTYARIERFLQDVRRGKCAHVGLTPEMLNEIEA